jgi:DNA helicase II / ATP-dependent DNA helicase PcrA
MEKLKLCDTRESIISTAGHLLIEGGPGSGKTTIALLKAQRIIEESVLLTNQKILFLSFARATIARIEEHAKAMLIKQDSKKIEINTYHGFTWSLIQNYGYLISSKRIIRLVPPPNAAALMTKIERSERDDFQLKLFQSEGLLCFDMFASVAFEILKRSDRIRNIISDSYPVIIVDEFQDTNSMEWELIKMLGNKSKIVALADLQQRIYDFRGASITRIPEFNSHFNGTRFDLGKDNHRSGNTDIAVYGDDLLTGTNIGKAYDQVIVNKYRKNFQDNFAPLKYEVIKSINRLKTQHPNNKWSIAILVKSKQATLSVSASLSQGLGNLPAIYHEVLMDPSGPALAAIVIATVLEPVTTKEDLFKKLLLAIITHLKGRKSDGASKADIKLIDALEKYIEEGKITGKNRILFISEIKSIVDKRAEMVLAGIPATDWLSVRKLFENCTHENLHNVYLDAIYLRLLNKGAILNEDLAEKWRTFQSYHNATGIVDAALLQEHFSMTSRNWHGIFVMTIHKSKGKEFDEVIIWEDQYRTILPPNASTVDIERTKLALRVAITRAKSKTTILTCRDQPCSLI